MEEIETRSGVNGAGKPFVTIHWGEKSAQWTVEEARQFALTVLETAEGAEHDAIFWSWMLENLPKTPVEGRAKILADLRVHRERLQGVSEES